MFGSAKREELYQEQAEKYTRKIYNELELQIPEYWKEVAKKFPELANSSIEPDCDGYWTCKHFDLYNIAYGRGSGVYFLLSFAIKGSELFKEIYSHAYFEYSERAESFIDLEQCISLETCVKAVYNGQEIIEGISASNSHSKLSYLPQRLLFLGKLAIEEVFKTMNDPETLAWRKREAKVVGLMNGNY